MSREPLPIPSDDHAVSQLVARVEALEAKERDRRAANRERVKRHRLNRKLQQSKDTQLC